MTNDEIRELQERFDGRYKLRTECEDDMETIKAKQHEHDVKVALYDHDFKILKWLGGTTLGAVLVELIALLFARLV